MLVTLEELKNSLRIETTDDDELLSTILEAAHKEVAHVMRKRLSGTKPVAKIAVLYAATYMYEHRENADFHEMTLTLRALLFGVRKEVF